MQKYLELRPREVRTCRMMRFIGGRARNGSIVQRSTAHLVRLGCSQSRGLRQTTDSLVLPLGGSWGDEFWQPLKRNAYLFFCPLSFKPEATCVRSRSLRSPVAPLSIMALRPEEVEG